MRTGAMLVGLMVFVLACQNQAADASANESADFEIIAHGEVVDLTEHLSEKGLTVFDFYADWCPPCKKLDASLVDLKKVYGDRMTVRKMDIVDWKSEMAAHFQIKDLPYLMIYDSGKNLIASGPSKDVLPKLIGMLNE